MNYYLKNLKRVAVTKSLLLILALGIILSLPSFTSEKLQWTYLRTVKTIPIKNVSIDRYSNIFVSDDKGNLFRYDSLGNESLKYSPLKKAEISILESWRTVNIFMFYRELQEFNIIDRFLTTSSSNFKFLNEVENDEISIGFARLATIAGDNNIWVFDDEDFSLKKYHTQLNKVIINTPLELILNTQYYDLNFIREYQNLVFINDKNSGVLVFDNLGNYKNKIDAQGINYFNFLDNYLYFIKDDKLVMLDIYKGDQQSFNIPEGKKYQFILLTRSLAYLFDKDQIDIYKFDYKE